MNCTDNNSPSFHVSFSMSKSFSSSFLDMALMAPHQNLQFLILHFDFIQHGTNDFQIDYNLGLFLEPSGFSIIIFSKLIQGVMSWCVKYFVFFLGDWVDKSSTGWKRFVIFVLTIFILIRLSKFHQNFQIKFFVQIFHFLTWQWQQSCSNLNKFF